MAAHNTTHPKVKPSVYIGASASGDNTPKSNVLLRGLFEALGSNERDGVAAEVVANGDDATLAFGGTKATTDACCMAERSAKEKVFESESFMFRLCAVAVKRRLLTDDYTIKFIDS
jgi:hypothetical protein